MLVKQTTAFSLFDMCMVWRLIAWQMWWYLFELENVLTLTSNKMLKIASNINISPAQTYWGPETMCWRSVPYHQLFNCQVFERSKPPTLQPRATISGSCAVILSSPAFSSYENEWNNVKGVQNLRMKGKNWGLFHKPSTCTTTWSTNTVSCWFMEPDSCLLIYPRPGKFACIACIAVDCSIWMCNC